MYISRIMLYSAFYKNAQSNYMYQTTSIVCDEGNFDPQQKRWSVNCDEIVNGR